MDRLAMQPRPARARKSLWTREDGTGVRYDGTTDDVAVSPDFAGNPNTGDAPDICALELI